MTESDVTIKQIRLEIDVPSKEEFGIVSKEFPIVLKDLLLVQIENCINTVFKEEDFFEIDAITLNLGDIDLLKPRDFVYNFTKKFIRELERYKQNKNLPKRTKFYLISYFLYNGRLPWWCDSKTKFNKFLEQDSYRDVSRKELISLLSQKNNLKRFLNILSPANKTTFFKFCLDYKYDLFSYNTSLLLDFLKEKLTYFNLKNIDIIEKKLLHKTLFYKDTSKDFDALVLDEVIFEFGFKWHDFESFLSKNSISLKPYDPSKISTDQLLISELDYSEKSKTFAYLLDQYIFSKQVLSGLKYFELKLLFNRYLESDKKTIQSVIRKKSLLEVFSGSYKLIKLIEKNNYLYFLELFFNLKESQLLLDFYVFLYHLKSGKFKSQNNSFSYFFDALLDLKKVSSASASQFFTHLIKLISNKYKINDLELISRFYFFHINKQAKFKYDFDIESFFYNQLDLEGFIFSSSTKFKTNSIHATLQHLSAFKKSEFASLKKLINYLNASIFKTKWKSDKVNEYVFGFVTKSNKESDNFFELLNNYSELNKTSLEELLLSTLKALYFEPTLSYSKQLYFEDLLYQVVSSHNYKTFFLKEESFIQELLKQDDIKDNLDLHAINDNLQSSKAHNIVFKGYNEKNSPTIFNKKSAYIINTFQPILNKTNTKFNDSSFFSKYLYLEFKINYKVRNDFNYAVIIDTISKSSGFESDNLTLRLISNIVKKSSYSEFDQELIQRLTELIFSPLKSFKNNISTFNSAYELVDSVNDKKLKQKLITTYLLNSQTAMVSLNSDNFNKLISTISNHKNNKFYEILMNVLSYFTYHKRVEILFDLKFKALHLIKANKNLKDSDFRLALLKEVKSIDEKVYQKITQNVESNSKLDKSDLQIKSLSHLLENPIKAKENQNQGITNSITEDDFDYFLILKLELFNKHHYPFLQLQKFDTLLDITKNNKSLLEFLKIHSQDHEILYEFSQLSISEALNDKLETLLKANNVDLLSLEQNILLVQNKTFFCTLHPKDFHLTLRVLIFKKLSTNHKILNTELVLDFLQMLAQNRNLNFKVLQRIYLKGISDVDVDVPVKKALQIFLENNNFQNVDRKVKDDVYYKNLFINLLENETLPVWSKSKSTDTEDAFDFIDSKIALKDYKFIRTIFENNHIKNKLLDQFIKAELTKKNELLTILEAEKAKSFSLTSILQDIDKLNLSTDNFFEAIIKKKLWKEPSALVVYERFLGYLDADNIKELLDLEFKHKLRLNPISLLYNKKRTLDKTDKLELIKYFLRTGELPKSYQSNLSNQLQVLKSFIKSDQSILRYLIPEFNQTENISKAVVKLSSKSVLFKSVLSLLKDKNTDMHVLLKPPLEKFKDVAYSDDFYVLNLVLKRLINRPSNNLTTSINFFKEIQQYSKELSAVIFENGTRLLDDGKISMKSVVAQALDLYHKKEDRISEDEESYQLNDLRYFIEFHSLDTSNPKHQTKFLRSFVLKNKKDLKLRNQIYIWAKQKIKLQLFLKIFNTKDLHKLLYFIHPELNKYLIEFDKLLDQSKLKKTPHYLNVKKDEDYIYELFSIWAKNSLIMYSPNLIIHEIFKKIASAEIINNNHETNSYFEVTDIFVQQKPRLTNIQNNMLSYFLKEEIILESKNRSEKENKNDDLIEQNNINTDSAYISNAGLVILWPFLSTLFDKIGLIDGRKFKDDTCKQKAILISQYVINKNEKISESDLLLNKLLCGAEVNFFVDVTIEFTENEKNIANSLLVAVTKNWKELNNTSPQSLQDTFLKREGKLNKSGENNFELTVQTKPYDLLLKTIPWNIKMIQTAFMDNRLIVNWEI
ncbi:contractile injection system tape measure protein [Psychroflexus planctonicus]|uniref:Uncharacterized protein n=1 Tax=Psychroflexus planctonicus TaxID=1526575 RepID=A0ABQ1SKB5_9FLAO|nr:contractile injection system tape measure protein [Psychroflexus planctonicus]GGE41077.1 hypothetical protein GCM10010832_21420 [Psychroflexus planctonicus]